MKKLITALPLFLFIACGNDSSISHVQKENLTCTTYSNEVGAYIDCSDGTSSFIPNGIDGEKGEDASNVELVTVCPDSNYSHPETLVKVAGDFMAFLTHPQWKKQRLVKLEENKVYETTDGRNIRFEIVNGSLEVISVCP